MYESLGDYEEQEALRQETPQGTHCLLLKRDPDACSICPKNPYASVDQERVAAESEEWAATIGRGLRLYGFKEAGVALGLDDLIGTDGQILLATAAGVGKYRERQRDRDNFKPTQEAGAPLDLVGEHAKAKAKRRG